MLSLWKMKMQSASWRGVSFGVNAASDAAGRQTVTHVFPQAEAPYVEDLGPAPRVIQITGFVLGGDYMSKRDRLQKALDEKGPGTLVHPWYGSLYVSLTKATVTHSADDGGMAVFQLEFVRVKKPDSPKASVDVKGLAKVKAAVASALSGSVLQAAMQLQEYGEYVLNEAQSAVTGALDAVTETLGVNPLEVADWVQDVYADASELYGMVVSAANFGSSFVSLISGMADLLPFSTSSSSSSSGGGTGQSPARLFALAAAVQDVAVPERAGISRTVAAQNADAVAQATRQAAAIEALRLAAEYVPATRGEAMTLRGQIVDAVQTVRQSCTDDALFAAIADLQSAALQALAQNAGTAPDVVTVSVQQTRNALALAYRWAGTADDAEDIITRNGVRHPGFVRGGKDLEVLL